MDVLKRAVNHFIDFHQGTVNITVHVIGFAGLFYSIYKLDWRLFAISIIILESGHVYNHVTGIKPYDFRLRVLILRGLIFITLVTILYMIRR